MNNSVDMCVVGLTLSNPRMWLTIYTIMQENDTHPSLHLLCPCDIPICFPRLEVFQMQTISNLIEIV